MTEFNPEQLWGKTFGETLRSHLDQPDLDRNTLIQNLGLNGPEELEGILDGSVKPPRDLGFYSKLTEHIPDFTQEKMLELLRTEGAPRVLIGQSFRESPEGFRYIDPTTMTDEELEQMADEINRCITNLMKHRFEEKYHEDEI